MKRFVIMMFTVALAFLLTTSLAVTNDNFEFMLPPGYETVQEKISMGVYQKEGTVLMYAVKSIYGRNGSEVVTFNSEEMVNLVVDMYGEKAPIVENKSIVSVKNCDAVRMDITNEQGVKSVLFFTNSDSAIILLAFSGTVFDEEEMSSVLRSFEVKGFNQHYALIAVGVVVAFMILLIVVSRGKKK